MAVPENGDLHRTMWGKPIISHHVQRNSYIYRGGKQNRCLVRNGSTAQPVRMWCTTVCGSRELLAVSINGDTPNGWFIMEKPSING